jgi:hypothetical protein
MMERDHWGDGYVDGRKIFRRIIRKWEGLGDWMELALVGDR